MPKDSLQPELYFVNNSIQGYRQYLREEGAGVLEDLERN
jgi:hypothetical protein